MTRLDFNKDSEAFAVFEQLQQEGIKKREFDRGYSQIDYSQPGPNQTLIGQGDGVIDEVEVYQTALDLYEAEPENARYRRIVEGFAGDPIPWELNDYNSKTNFDEIVRAKVNKAISELDRLLVSKGFTKGTDDYNKRMAIGLFHFVDFPDDHAQARIYRVDFLDLLLNDLGEFKDKLVNEIGGLGVSQMIDDAPIEATALEALQTKKGWCTERSKILYAVFRMAGLKPFFVASNFEDLEGILSTKGVEAPPSMKDSGHIYIGIALEASPMYFDLTHIVSQNQTHNLYHQRLIHYLAVDKSNFATDLDRVTNHQSTDAEKILRTAYCLDPGNPLTSFNLTALLVKRGQYEEAVKISREGIDANPTAHRLYFALGSSLFSLGRLDEAEQALKKVIELEPDDVAAYMGLIKVYRTQGMTDKVEELQGQVEHLSGQSSQAQAELGKSLFSQGKFKEAEAAFRKAIDLSPNEPLYYVFLGIIIAKQGNFEEGLKFMVKAYEYDLINIHIEGHYEQNQSNIIYSIEQLKQLGKIDQAIEIFTQAISSDLSGRSTPASLSDLHTYLGYAYGTQGQMNEAVSELETAIQLDSSNFHAHLLLANAYVMEGDLDKAIMLIEGFTRRYPDKLEAQQALEALRVAKTRESVP